MSRTILALFVVMAVLSVSLAQPSPADCKDNETFVTCGSQCQPTCANPSAHVDCTYQCRIGCQCNDGYVRNSDNVCVPLSEC